MKSRYHYAIFFILGLSVVGIIFLSFKYAGNPQSSIIGATEASNMDDTTNMSIQYTKNSWLGQIKALNQKSYFYALSEMQIELN